MSPRFARWFYLLYESIDGPLPRLALRQSENTLADDVALHFRGAAIERCGQCVVAFEGEMLVGEPGRPGDGRRQLPGPLQRLRAQQLEDGELVATAPT